MRVYELARALGRTSSDVIAQLRADGEWVSSHQSAVPEPIVRRLLPGPLAPASQPPSPSPKLTAIPVRLPPRPKSTRKQRRRPGPQPLTMQRTSWDDDYDDSIRNLRYERSITTRDVADLLGVAPATVRQWAARGHITVVGKLGSSSLFDPREVLTADAEIATRRKATGQARRSGWQVDFGPATRISPKHHDALVTAGEAARLVGVSPATIRSWLHRGHLVRLPSSTHRTIELRLGDVIDVARRRNLPKQGSIRRR